MGEIRNSDRQCIWCRKPFDRRVNRRTKDHLVPKSLGGADGDNLKYACIGCNRDRGTLTSFYLQQHGLRDEFQSFSHFDTNRRKRLLERFFEMAKSLRVMQGRWSRWTALEKSVLGFSPTESFPLLDMDLSRWESYAAPGNGTAEFSMPLGVVDGHRKARQPVQPPRQL